MGYITLVESAEERAAGLPKSGNAEGATITMGAQGGVTLRITTTPQGQGHRTVAAQVAADVLGLDPEQIDVRTDADTAANPWTVSSGNYSSRFAAMGASAVHLAATRLAGRLRALAAPLLGCAPEDVELTGGRARVRGDDERSVSVRRLAGGAHWHPSDLTGEAAEGLALTVTYTLPISPPDEDDRVNSSACYGFVADVCVVEIDPETAEVAVRAVRHGARRGPAAQPAPGRRPGARRSCPRPGCRPARGAPVRRGRQPHDRDIPRLPAAHGHRAAARRLGAPGVALAARRHSARRASGKARR